MRRRKTLNCVVIALRALVAMPVLMIGTIAIWCTPMALFAYFYHPEYWITSGLSGLWAYLMIAAMLTRSRPRLLHVLTAAATVALVILGLSVVRGWMVELSWAIIGFGGLCIGAVLTPIRPEARPGFCGACGYDLSGIRGEVCPECGRRVGGAEDVAV